jgi:uncharacterized protein (TIGR02391 family)
VSRRWDNIEILQAVDRLQETAGGAPAWRSGLELMEDVAGERVAEHQRWAGFLQELQIAQRGGLLEFRVSAWPGGSGPQPSDPYQYLQRVRDFALTVAGQDRARGQRVAATIPDPAEDDGRPISSMILTAIAEAIEAEYQEEALQEFLRESGMPLGQPLLEEADHNDLGDVLRVLYRSGSEGRRILRSFIGRWLDDRLLSDPPDEVRRKLLDHLARQGWYVANGSLVTGEPSTRRRTSGPVLREARLAALHPEIAEVAERYVRAEHHAAGIQESLKALCRRMRHLAGDSRDGYELANAVLSSTSPKLILADLTTDTGRNTQDGYRSLFAGVMRAWRNPGAHEPFEDMDENEAFEQLGLVSLLMRRLGQTAR